MNEQIRKWGLKLAITAGLLWGSNVFAQPVNDNASNAVLLVPGAGCPTTFFDNTGATAAPGELTASCRSSFAGPRRPVWFKFVAPASGAVRISTDHGGSIGTSGTRTAVFEATDSSNYNTFNIIHCAGNSGITSVNTNILYPAGLTPGATYYVVVDVYYSGTQGTFCITVDELNGTMVSTTAGDCVSGNSMGGYSWTGTNADYHGWISLTDNQGRLNANVRQLSGDANTFSGSVTVSTGPSRMDANGKPYLNRNYFIKSIGGSGTTSADVRLFFTTAELNALGSSLDSLNISRVADTTCKADFTCLADQLMQTGSGSSNGVSWVSANTTSLSNFFIHSGAQPLGPPKITSFADTFRCGPGSVTLKASAVSGATIQWYADPTGGIPLATGNNFNTPVINTTTSYYIAAKSGNCESTPRQLVTANILTTVVDLGNDTTICPGVTYTFDAGNPGAGYLWSTGANTQTITIDTAGIYSVEVSDGQCVANDTVVIVPGVVPVNAMPDSADLCEGSTMVLDAGNQGSTFSWSPVNLTTQTILIDDGGPYEVDIRSMDGCSITSSSYVKLIPLPVIDLGADTVICNGQAITLDAGNPGAAYLWSTSASAKTIDVDTGGIYWVEVMANGCSDTDTISLTAITGPMISGINATYSDSATYVFYPLDTLFVSAYSWDFGDGSPIVSGYRVQHTYSSNGIYTVTCYLGDICDGRLVPVSRTVDVFDGTTGIREADAGKDWSVHPNPSDNVLYIRHEAASGVHKASLYSLTGQCVRTTSFSGSDVAIEVSGLAPGIYILRVGDQNGSSMIRKIEIRR